jgi:glycosyltransferase involved in cell wall biosynthesis
MSAMGETGTKPRVSVVMPVYCATPDHERFLREALESVAAQTYRDFEVVLVDDRSPIDPLPVIAPVEGLPRTELLRNAANLGHAESRNAGVRTAQGEIIAFLDHDDLWRPTKLERQLEVLDRNPDAAMVFCDVEISGHYPEGLYIDQATIPDRPSLTWFVSRPNSVITVSSVLVKKQALLEIGLFDSGYSSCDDFDAWIKILSQWPIVHLPETLATYRLHEYNVNYAVDSLRDNRLLTSLIWSIWKSASPSGKLAFLPAIARKLAGRVYFSMRQHIGRE